MNQKKPTPEIPDPTHNPEVTPARPELPLEAPHPDIVPEHDPAPPKGPSEIPVEKPGFSRPPGGGHRP